MKGMTRTAKLMLAVGVTLLPLFASAPASAGGGCRAAMEGSLEDRTGTTVELVRNCMSPNVLRIEAGTAVTFVNRDATRHNVTAPGLFKNLESGETFVKHFHDSGTYAFACTLHAGMTGAVVVGADESEVTPIAAAPAATTSARGSLPRSVLAGAGATLLVLGAFGGFLAGRRRSAP